MKYDLIKLDNRFSHRDKFGYAIKFSNSSSRDSGPLHFNDALKWFFDTYGWSAEIRQYDNMLKWVTNSQRIIQQFASGRTATGILTERPDACNPHWSWTNGYDDLRIYVRGEEELAFFQLKYGG